MAKIDGPKKRRRLFVDDGTSHGTVILNWHNTPEKEFTYMAEAFYDAAKEGIQKLKANRHFGIEGIPLEDFQAYPVIFLYRHALELSMKALLRVGADMLTLKGLTPANQQTLRETHSLNWLREEVERVFAAYGWTWNCGNDHFRTVNDLRSVIAEFDGVDPGSYAFRYPITTKGLPSLEDSFKFSVFRFAEVLDSVMPTLIGAISGAYYEYQNAAQEAGEAHEEAMRYEMENYYPDYYDDYEPGEDY